MDKLIDLVIALNSGEKSALNAFRALIDILVIVIVSNYLFKWYFIDYSLVNIYDYESIVKYILNGEFIFVIIFLLISFLVTNFVKTLVFNLMIEVFKKNFENKILAHQYFNNQDISDTAKPSADGEYNFLVKFLLKFFVIVYNTFKRVIENEEYALKRVEKRNNYSKSKKFDKSLKEYSKSLKQGLNSLISLFLLILFLKFVLVNFPLILFIITILILGFTITLYSILYRTIIVIPLAIDDLLKQEENLKKNKP